MDKLNYAILGILSVMLFFAVKIGGAFTTVYTIVASLSALCFFPLGVLINKKSIAEERLIGILTMFFISLSIGSSVMHVYYSAEYLKNLISVLGIISFVSSVLFYVYDKR
jgi:hypothetical protein